MDFRELTSTTDKRVLKNFYYDNPTDYMQDKAGDVEGALYYGAFKQGILVGITSFVEWTPHLVMIQNTMVTPHLRGQGVGRLLNTGLETVLKELGYGKIVSHVYVENLPSLILKLKLGYLIEGTLRDHDRAGQHEYILGKIL